MSSLSSLYQESKRLTTHIAPDSNLPSLEKSLDLISASVKKLAKSSFSTSLHPKTTYLLAEKGFDPAKLQNSLAQIQVSTAFEPLESCLDTDLESFLRNEHDTLISCALQESRNANLRASEELFEQKMINDWNNRKRAILSVSVNKKQARGNLSFLKVEPGITLPKEKAFVSSVTEFNVSRLIDGDGIKLLNMFKQAAGKVGVQDSEHDLIQRCWDLLITLFSKSGKLAQMELKNNSRKWLENSYLEWLKNHVRGRRMQIGGIPSVHMEVDAMIRLRFKRNDIWSVQWLDASTVPDQAFWAHVFLLVRCGLNHEALDYVKMNQKYLDNTTDRYFATYLSAWISSPDGVLPKNLQDRLSTEWNGHIRDILADSRLPPRGDVFKFTLYKIIGQCEMNSKNVKCDAVISSTDDYLWLQLMLVRPTKRSDPPYQRYTMNDFAAKMVSYGPNYFKSTSIYYMVLLLCGEFERAVELLSKDPAFAVDALHVAIALVYLGVLKVPEDPTVLNLTGSLLSIHSSQPNPDGYAHEVVTFDFARFLLSFVKKWAYTNPLDSLQYLYTLGLLGGSPSNTNSETSQKAYTAMVHAGIRDVVLCTDSFISILGEIRPDGTRSPGELDKFKSLIQINTSKELADHIILPAAQVAETTGISAEGEDMFAKTVQLYHLAARYEYVITLLNRKLSESLCGHQYFLSSVTDMDTSTGTFPSNSKNIVELSQQLVSFYRSRSHLLSMISPKAMESCTLLISLHRFMAEIQAKLDVQALISLERLDILPLNPELLTVQRKVDLFRNIDETIARVIPDVLVAAMTCLERLYNPPKVAAKDSSTRDSLKMQAKALLMFAGCVQYRISGDVFATLNRLDVMMI